MLRYVYIIVIVVVVAREVLSKTTFPMPRLEASCTTTTVRRDLVTLSPAEQQRFFRVVREMHRRGWMDGFGSMHDHIAHQIHGNDQFFAWHRRFLRHFESLMQEIDPEAVLPYWNWATYWQSPFADPVLSSAFFGGNGRPVDNCVLDGAEARWGRNYPTRGCLTRKFRHGASTGSFWPMRAIRDVMSSARTHAQFRSRIENGAHGIVHLGLGGDFETMWAPVDVLFFLHHAMIDKIWAEWQTRDPQRYERVDGYDFARQAFTADSIMPFYGEDVASTLLTNGPGYCYTYDDLPAPPAIVRKHKAFMTVSVAANTTAAAPAAVSSVAAAPSDQPDQPDQQLPEEPELREEAPTDAPASADEEDAAADPAASSDEPAAQLFANPRRLDGRARAKIVDFAAPQPMDSAWLKQGHYDVDEATRMQRLVDDVVAEINAERKQGM